MLKAVPQLYFKTKLFSDYGSNRVMNEIIRGTDKPVMPLLQRIGSPKSVCKSDFLYNTDLFMIKTFDSPVLSIFHTNIHIFCLWHLYCKWSESLKNFC